MGSQLPDDPSNQSAPLARPTQSHEYGPATPDEQPTSPPVSLYAQQNPYPSPALLGNDRGRGQAIAGLTLGIMSILTWLILFGGILVGNTRIVVPAPVLDILSYTWLILFGDVLVALVGIVVSAQGRRALSRKGLATAGLVLSIIGLVLAIGTPLFILAKDISEI